jgi:hypothetical protein
MCSCIRHTWLERSTFIVSSQHLLKTPSVPVTPIASTISVIGKYINYDFHLPLVSLNGTISGVLSVFPCSKATPKSMCTNSAVHLSIRMLWECLSPSPTMYPNASQHRRDVEVPVIELEATLLTYANLFVNHSTGLGKYSEKKWWKTGLKLLQIFKNLCGSLRGLSN